MSSKLKIIRSFLKLSQKDFAKKLGIKQAYYSAIEIGKREPSASVLGSLFAINISPEWFYNDNGDMFNPSSNDTTNSMHENIANNTNINNLMYAKSVEDMSLSAEQLEIKDTMKMARAFSWLVVSDYAQKHSIDFSIDKFEQLASIYKLLEEGLLSIQLAMNIEIGTIVGNQALKEKIENPERNEHTILETPEIDKVIKKYVDIYRKFTAEAPNLMNTINILQDCLPALTKDETSTK